MLRNPSTVFNVLVDLWDSPSEILILHHYLNWTCQTKQWQWKAENTEQRFIMCMFEAKHFAEESARMRSRSMKKRGFIILTSGGYTAFIWLITGLWIKQMVWSAT